jgi:hypothetical protein
LWLSSDTTALYYRTGPLKKTCHPSTKNKYSKVPKRFLFLYSCKRIEGSSKEKSISSKRIEKIDVLQSKSIEKK